MMLDPTLEPVVKQDKVYQGVGQPSLLINKMTVGGTQL